jgi:hypothetical protein
MKSIIGKLFGAGKGREVTYEQAKELANHKDDEIRRELASQPEIRPEILYYLTDDPSPAVRAEVARNEATPARADLLLARDKDDDVRFDLAAKISRLAPGLTANEKPWRFWPATRLSVCVRSFPKHSRISRMRRPISFGNWPRMPRLWWRVLYSNIRRF